MTEWWWAYIALGAFVGFFSGLLGIGGGSAMVPVLAFIFVAKEFPQEHAVHLALGTALASVVITSASSVRSHHLHGAVNWSILRTMVPGVIAGTFGGALLAGVLDVRTLSIAFTVLIYYLGFVMLRRTPVQPVGPIPRPAIMAGVAAGIGFVSSLTATAGASLVVAFLVKRGVTVHHAIGTAAAVGWPLAVAGTVGYIIAGTGAERLPEYSVGYVYLPALMWIVAASVLMAPVGANVAHRTPAPALKRVMAFVLLALATSMLLTFL
jgi:uncharacterized protein